MNLSLRTGISNLNQIEKSRLKMTDFTAHFYPTSPHPHVFLLQGSPISENQFMKMHSTAYMGYLHCSLCILTSINHFFLIKKCANRAQPQKKTFLPAMLVILMGAPSMCRGWTLPGVSCVLAPWILWGGAVLALFYRWENWGSER